MNKEAVWKILTHKDYQIASAIISWLNNCQTWDEFNQAVQIALLPLIACNGAFCVQQAAEHSSWQLLGSINQSGCCSSCWEQFLTSILLKTPDSSTLKNAPNAPSSVAITNNPLAYKGNLICQLHTPGPSWQQSHHSCSLITLFDDRQPAYRLYFCQVDVQQQLFNQRAMELLQLLHPVLLQTLRFIIFREESIYPRQTRNFWADHTESILIIQDNGTILYQSYAFIRTIEQDKHQFLMMALDLVQYVQNNQLDEFSILSKLGKRLYTIKLTSINTVGGDQQQSYLLHLSRVASKNGKIFNRLDRTGLTSRELEIATLMYQGNSPKEIAEEINLSYHTVRNHIKHIYSKLGVATRSEMLVKLT